jgi:competence protein ComEC
MRWITGWFASQVLAQRGALFPWLPVVLSVGIAAYFSLRSEPSIVLLWAAAGGAFTFTILTLRVGAALGPVFIGLAVALAGFGWAGTRAHLVSAPVLDWRYYGPVEGRLVGLDRSASDAVRLTFDQVVLRGIAPDQTPARVRISLHGDQGFTDLMAGGKYIVTAHLSGPRGAVEPGGFDFRRHAWFLRLGAIGYTRTPVLALEHRQGEVGLLHFRLSLADRVRAALPGQSGAMAAALLTGDRSGVSQKTLKDLRYTNLAHLLAISGLHMGLLVGVVFFAVRYVLACVPWVALRWPIKRMAAFAALLAATGYLALSGGNVATERAFIMAAVALTAVMLDRRALSLRAVALAAMIVLILRPEALMSPGFQMSFAATTALVSVFTAFRSDSGWPVPNWVKPILATVLSSAVAGFATAPVAMAHFNILSHYGLFANLSTVPLMGIWVIPWGAIAMMVMPLSLEYFPLMAMGWGIDWILFVADQITRWPGVRSSIPSPTAAVLPVMALGAAWLVIWQGWGRLIGIVPIFLSVLFWFGTDRPDILISEDGGLVGVRTDDGLALNRSKGSRFVASSWLENDGTLRSQSDAAALWPEKSPIRIVRGKRQAAAFKGCEGHELVISNQPLGDDLPCTVWDPPRLLGQSVAGWQSKNGWYFITERTRSGSRLWSASGL